MLESYLVKGLLVGLVFGVPAGAIGALTLQRSLAHGFTAGFVTGLGSSAADLLYACIGICGYTVLSDFLQANQTIISLIGGAMILLIGMSIFRKKSAKQPAGPSQAPNSLLLFFGSSFAISIANPATMLAFFVAFSSFGIADKILLSQGCQLVLGILIGTCCWWCALSGAAALFSRRVTDALYQKLGRVLGSLMLLFGGAVIFRAF